MRARMLLAALTAAVVAVPECRYACSDPVSTCERAHDPVRCNFRDCSVGSICNQFMAVRWNESSTNDCPDGEVLFRPPPSSPCNDCTPECEPLTAYWLCTPPPAPTCEVQCEHPGECEGRLASVPGPKESHTELYVGIACGVTATVVSLGAVLYTYCRP